MATITSKNDPRLNVGRTPWGNAHQLQYTLKTKANGAPVDGSTDGSAPIASGDKVVLGRIPGGSVLGDFMAVVSTAFTAAVVGKLGFEYADGVDDPLVPQDDDYFATALALNATGVLRKTTTTPVVTLNKDAVLTLTTGGAANAKDARLDIVLYVASEGTP